jgi:hypothetical protein
MTWQQGMPSLMGNVMRPPAAQVPSLMNYQPGDWSKVAYQMAGSPNQGPYPSVPTPPMPAGVTNGTASSGGSAIGGTALGLLSVLAKNPSLIKSAYNGVSGLLGGTAPADVADTAAAAGDAASGLDSGAAAGATAYGTDAAVTPAVSPLTSELPATATGTYAAPAASAPAASAAPAAAAAAPAVGGLMGGSALGAGAPGVFASGNAAAGSAGAASGLSGAGLAASTLPFAALAGIALSNAASADSANNAGNSAMNAWMKANGVTYKPAAWNTNSGQSTFGSEQMAHGGQSPGTFIGANGQPLTEKQAETAMVLWARAHGMPTGNMNYTGG